MKQAVVYERKGVIYMRTSSQTEDGVWIDEGPCLSLPTESSSDQIGEAAKKVLDSSRTGILHPTSWNSINDGLLAKAGVKSWSTFGKSARCLNLELESNIRISPTRNGGNQEGFVLLADKARTLIVAVSPAEFGDNIKQALEHCE